MWIPFLRFLFGNNIRLARDNFFTLEPKVVKVSLRIPYRFTVSMIRKKIFGSGSKISELTPGDP